MNLRKLATNLEGWTTVDNITRKLHIKRSSAYVYLSMLNKGGFITQKVKRPRGTAYAISQLPSPQKGLGMYEDTDLIAPEQEFTKRKVSAEQKIAFFLSKLKTGGSRRNYNEALKVIRKITNWRILYRYLKAYRVEKEFKNLYEDARNIIKKLPRMPRRYKNLLGVK